MIVKAGQLTALCYPYVPDDKFRVICDFIGFLFHLDNISDGVMKKETKMLDSVVMKCAMDSDEIVYLVRNSLRKK